MVPPYSLTFGPFSLHFPQRALTKDGEPVRLGSRALDILVVLVESAGQLMSTRDLCDRVWAGSVVDEGALRVHMSALRKALGDSNEGVRYVVNETGRGYRFEYSPESFTGTELDVALEICNAVSGAW